VPRISLRCTDLTTLNDVITNSDRPGYPLHRVKRPPALLLTSNLGQKSFEPPGRTPPAGGGWRCVEVPPTGYTATANAKSHQGLFFRAEIAPPETAILRAAGADSDSGGGGRGCLDVCRSGATSADVSVEIPRRVSGRDRLLQPHFRKALSEARRSNWARESASST
jgi:hypothetical protein